MGGGRPSETKRQDYKEKLKWLDLSKYKGVRDLSAFDWRDQLAFRRDLLDKAKFWIAHCQSEHSRQELEQDLQWLLGLIQANPLVDFEQLDKRWIPDGIYDFPMLFFLRNTSSYLHLGVHATTVEEFYLAEAHSQPERVRYARQFFDELSDIYEDFKRGLSIEEHFAAFMSRYWQKWDAAHCPPHIHLDYEAAKQGLKYLPWMEEPIDHRYSRRQLFLTVDTSAPDSRLEKEFKRALSEHRASAERVEMPIINTDSWADAGLLPYIDIRIWALLNNEPEIDPFAIRDVILPPWKRTDYTVKRVTEPAFNRLMNSGREEFGVLVMLVAEELLLWSHDEVVS